MICYKGWVIFIKGGGTTTLTPGKLFIFSFGLSNKLFFSILKQQPNKVEVNKKHFFQDEMSNKLFIVKNFVMTARPPAPSLDEDDSAQL
jgi:hypothetical protein